MTETHTSQPDAETPYPALFSPIQVGSLRLPNRIVHSSMSTRYVVQGQVTQRLIDYHVARARGGASLLVTETMNVTHRQREPFKVNVYGGDDVPGLERWATQVRAAGGHLIGQLQDPGRGRHQRGRNQMAIGPSPLPDDMSWTVPHAPTTGELERLIDDFAASAAILRESGFSGVEVSAGHGHLFHQFLAASSNRRSDRFGGDLEARSRFLLETITATRSACGPDFLIGVKLPGEDGVPGGIDLEQAAEITRLVHASGCVDYLTYCWGAHADTLDWHLPDLHGERTPYAERIARLGANAPGVTIGALGLITDPNEGDRIVADGLADLVMLGRPLVTDPGWGIKSAAGREAEIRYCVSCNSCWGAINVGGPLVCDNNPRVGESDELDWKPARVEESRKVAVIGAGIAGMEAAWVAAARGHRVTVYCTSDDVGGKTRLHAALPGGEHLSSIYDYQRLQADRAGVEFVVGPPVEWSDVQDGGYDAFVLATGSTPCWPNFVPNEYRDRSLFPDVRQVAHQLIARTDRTPGTALVIDCDHTAFTYAVVELLTKRFQHVALVTPREALAMEEPVVNRQGINRRIYGSNVAVHTWSEPVWSDDIEDGALRLRHRLTGAEHVIEDIVLITYATARVPNDELATPIRSAAMPLHLIGDCYAPRSVLVATAEGHRIGNEL